MRKFLFFAVAFLLTSVPAFAQKLGSSSNPNPTGTAGAFAVYTPAQIEEDDDAAQDVFYEETTTNAKKGAQTRTQHRRMPNYWVLSGGEVDKTPQNADMDGKAPEPPAGDKKKEGWKPQPPVSEKAPAVEAGVDGNKATETETAATKEIAASEAQSVLEEEGALVCRKFEKCAICVKSKPYWNGQECVDKRMMSKMKKRLPVVSVNSVVSDGTASQNAATASGKAVQNDKTAATSKSGKAKFGKSQKSSGKSINAKTASSQNQNTGKEAVATDDSTNESTISVLNPDGTPKSRLQLERELEQARSKAVRKARQR